MQVWLAAVGRLRSGPLRDLYDDYAQRMTWPLTLKEIEAKKGLAGDALKNQEAELLLAAIPSDATIIALDERGKTMTSPALAHQIGAWRDTGVRNIAFLIGGADGHGDAVRQRANLTLALGAMTWPHMLVRVMIAEQIYRAQQILSGHPYHRA